MKYIYRFAIFSLLVVSCKGGIIDTSQEQRLSYNNELAKELSDMVKIDQKAVMAFKNNSSNLTPQQLQSIQDSIFAVNHKRVKDIFDEYGFVGHDLAGTEGSKAFWLLVQHSDVDPVFQSKVLQKMKVEMRKGNANSSDYGLLVDRVQTNQNKKQVYGTQVLYNLDTGQAYPHKISDSANVDRRRKSIGLPPLKVYLNQMSSMHFEMNREIYMKKGVNRPKLYDY